LLLLTACLPAMSQTCTGTLGNPVFSIDFGAGAGPGGPTALVPKDYQSTSQNCPAQGYYTLANSTASCFNNDWHIVPSDHTHTASNGYFLMLNLKPGTSDIFTDTIKGLCPNTTFNVSAWALNLVNPPACADPDPKLTFTVMDLSGTVITQYTTKAIGKTTSFNWKECAFQFQGPGSGSVILKISEASQGCSTGLALDDITFRPCAGMITATFANSSSTVQTCENNQPSYQLSANYSGLNNPSVQWQLSEDGNNWADIPGATGNIYNRQPSQKGFFYYRFSIIENNNTSCLFYSNTASVEVQSIFSQATNYVFGCYGAPVELFAAGGTFYNWTGPNGFASNSEGPVIPKVNFNNTGAYIVKVATTAGCTAYDTTNLVIYAAPVATALPQQSFVCDGNGIQLQASGSIRYKWQPSAGLSNDTIPNPIASPTENTTYIVRVYNEHTCYDTASVQVIVWKRPTVDAGPDKFTFKNRAVQLQGKVTGSDISYTWSPPTYLDNTSIDHPRAAPPSSITYTLTVTSNDGCGTVSDQVTVGVIDKMFIPSGFTPNADGLNDVWEIITFEEYPKGTVYVFNRWGQIVYFGKGLNYKPWDGNFNGQPVEAGTYVYLVDLHNGKPILKGTVTVIR
ncbi:MAG TPA: gliding motility-associated C-terminal domain-containing protein, partial [Chitinophagaceae bacterium]